MKAPDCGCADGRACSHSCADIGRASRYPQVGRQSGLRMLATAARARSAEQLAFMPGGDAGRLVLLQAEAQPAGLGPLPRCRLRPSLPRPISQICPPLSVTPTTDTSDIYDRCVSYLHPDAPLYFIASPSSLSPSLVASSSACSSPSICTISPRVFSSSSSVFLISARSSFRSISSSFSKLST